MVGRSCPSPAFVPSMMTLVTWRASRPKQALYLTTALPNQADPDARVSPNRGFGKTVGCFAASLRQICHPERSEGPLTPKINPKPEQEFPPPRVNPGHGRNINLSPRKALPLPDLADSTTLDYHSHLGRAPLCRLAPCFAFPQSSSQSPVPSLRSQPLRPPLD